jgi:hypothetical protein
MNISTPLIADFQTSKTMQPRKGTFNHPTIASEFLTAIDPTTSDAGDDPALAESLTQWLRVISLIGVQLLGALARPTATLTNGPDGIDSSFSHLDIMHVGSRLGHGKGNSSSVDHKMALRARFAAIRWVRPGRFAPPGAGTLAESSEARDQSICSACPNLSNKTWCNLSQTPAACQSLSRRQQVIPLPQPISCGSISQGIPVLSTNSIPVNAARSSTRGRPPLGFGRSGGNNGLITSHNSSVTRGFAMPPFYPVFGFC